MQGAESYRSRVIDRHAWHVRPGCTLASVRRAVSSVGERLMRKAGRHGVISRKVVCMMIADMEARFPLDRVNRRFRAQQPNQLWSALSPRLDLAGLRVCGLRHRRFRPPNRRWRVSSSMRTDLVLNALEQVLYSRQPERSVRSSQYVSIRYSKRRPGLTHIKRPPRKPRGSNSFAPDDLCSLFLLEIFEQGYTAVTSNPENKKPSNEGWAKCLIQVVPTAGLEPAT